MTTGLTSGPMHNDVTDAAPEDKFACNRHPLGMETKSLFPEDACYGKMCWMEPHLCHRTWVYWQVPRLCLWSCIPLVDVLNHVSAILFNKILMLTYCTMTFHILSAFL